MGGGDSVLASATGAELTAAGASVVVLSALASPSAEVAEGGDGGLRSGNCTELQAENDEYGRLLRLTRGKWNLISGLH